MKPEEKEKQLDIIRRQLGLSEAGEELGDLFDGLLASALMHGNRTSTPDALLKLVQEAGYEIKPGHNPSFRCEGWGRPVRLDTLGENDSRGVPLSVLKGEKRVAWGEDEQQSE